MAVAITVNSITSMNDINFPYLTSPTFKLAVIVILYDFYGCQIKSYIHNGEKRFVEFDNIFLSVEECQQ